MVAVPVGVVIDYTDAPPKALAYERLRSARQRRSYERLSEKHPWGQAVTQPEKCLSPFCDRGREITDYISTVASRGRLVSGNGKVLGDVLTSFVRMYEHHAAIEDTVIFPAWKTAIPKAQYEELSEGFEELEHRMFGKDGFDDAVGRIAKIEQAFGLADLSKLTAPPPPKPA